uniref:Uncharacterized protein n=1 Tax=Ananas comosus var. bracteatus TaxID=296719 RepID=A0A6V7PYS3_ANACO|nr:unnamed protein product [Ananas comosus var. bracteatus]
MEEEEGGGEGEGGYYEDDGDAWADLDREIPPHLRPSPRPRSARRRCPTRRPRIDDPVEDGDTVLHLACLYGHLSCVQLLLERGASLESKDEEGAIPLHDACAGGFSEIVQRILDFAGNPDCVMRMLNTVDAEGDTPLHHAARGEHLDVVKLLLAAGASPRKANAYGQTPADLADADTEVQSFLAALVDDAAE